MTVAVGAVKTMAVVWPRTLVVLPSEAKTFMVSGWL